MLNVRFESFSKITKSDRGVMQKRKEKCHLIMLKEKSTYKDYQTFKNKYLNLSYKNKLFVQPKNLLEIMLQENKNLWKSTNI